MRVKTAYVKQEAAKLVKESNGKLDLDIAVDAVRKRQNHVLADDDMLHFAQKKKPVPVAEVLDNGLDYDRKSCADPLEPEYDGGNKTKARFYWNDGNPIINSFAHGSTKYTFSRFNEKAIDYDEVLPDLIKRTATDCGAPFEPEMVAMLAQLKREDKARFMRVRNDLKTKNGDVSLAELDKAISAASRKKHRIQSSPPSSPSFSSSYPTPCPTLEGKALHLVDALIRENDFGTLSLAPQSVAAALFLHAEFDTAVTYLMYMATGQLGFSNSYESGAVALLKKNGHIRLPEPQSGMTPFQNGLLNHLQGKLIAVTPQNASTWILPFDYLKDACCPHFLTWLKTAVDDDGETIMLLRAWINALLTGRPDLQVFLHLIGPAGTGKSTFGRLVLVLVGEDNATTTSLKQLETNRFEAANIFGKRITAIEEADKFG